MTLSLETPEGEAEPPKIAHHGGEGVGAGALGITSGVQLIQSAPVKASAEGSADSLWADLLLGIAYRRDAELQKLLRKLNRLNTLVFASAAGVSGLGLAQGIYALKHIEPQTVDVTEAHHAGGHDHVHFPEESRTPSIMGIIGSGVTLGALGLRAVLGKRYQSQMNDRQAMIQERVYGVINRLEQGEPVEAVRQPLGELIGSRAAAEFLLLWKAVHPQPADSAAAG